VVRRRVDRAEVSSVVPRDCGTVWAFAKARQLAAGRHVAVYWNADIDLEVGVEVATAFDEGDDVVQSATPSGLAASVAPFGPYHRLGDAHSAIHRWCAAHNHRLVGPSWEVYGHWDAAWNADPSKIRTDVFYQVAPA